MSYAHLAASALRAATALAALAGGLCVLGAAQVALILVAVSDPSTGPGDARHLVGLAVAHVSLAAVACFGCGCSVLASLVVTTLARAVLPG